MLDGQARWLHVTFNFVDVLAMILMELQLRLLHMTLQSSPLGQSIVEEAQYPTLLLSALQIMVHDPAVVHEMVPFRY